MFAFIKSLRGQNSLATLLQVNVGACAVLFLLLEWWRPYFFLTDDNLSAGFPVFTEMGRHLQHGRSPFISDYLFGGHYDLRRDVGFLMWHPFYLGASLLADTPAQFCLIDLPAFLFLILTTTGFTLLAHSLRAEFKIQTPDIYLVFYTLSFVFSNYALTVGSSWVNTLANQSALPWLVLGILDKKNVRGSILIALFTMHELLAGYTGLTISTGLCLSLFAAGAAFNRRSSAPLMVWCAGNALALLVLSPFLCPAFEGFRDTPRADGIMAFSAYTFRIPVTTLPFSFFVGNCNEPFMLWAGDSSLRSLHFPYSASLLACGAAWCVIPATLESRKWQPLEILCLGCCLVLLVFIVRPGFISSGIQFIPIVKSLRWPFRESLQFLFFIHLFLVLRPQGRLAHLYPGIALWSLALFLGPLPLIRVPTFNALALDRQMILSGQGEKFWAQVKTKLGPTDEIATVVEPGPWKANVPYSLVGTANFPAFFQVVCITGYSQTAPQHQVPLRTRAPFTFGAFRPDQINALWAERPDLKIIEVMGSNPLNLSLRSKDAPPIDLTPYLPPQPVDSGKGK